MCREAGSEEMCRIYTENVIFLIFEGVIYDISHISGVDVRIDFFDIMKVYLMLLINFVCFRVSFCVFILLLILLSSVLNN